MLTPGANGDPVVKTPAFDRVARRGIRFTHAFCDAPTCGPSRSAILTGQPIWRLEEAGNLWSTLPKKFITYPEVLTKAGYSVGFTGKAWSPGRFLREGAIPIPQVRNFRKRKLKPSFKAMRNTDYAANFDDFLGQVKRINPSAFGWERVSPIVDTTVGAGKRTGKDPSKVIVPGIFPDNSIVRNDILDYYVEVEHFRQNGRSGHPLLGKRLANWKIPSWSSPVIMGCLFHGPKPAFMMPVLVFHLPFVGPRGFENPVGFLMHW